jgi:hypothetical protein
MYVTDKENKSKVKLLDKRIHSSEFKVGKVETIRPRKV